MIPSPLTELEFKQFQAFIYEAAGISLSSAKKALVAGRLAKRLQHNNIDSYGAYYRLLSSGNGSAEVQMAVDLLTTNETYFFREPKHFDLLRELALNAHKRHQRLRVWSAASSTGEEAYSIAMVLADHLKDGAWEVFGSDISQRVLATARRGLYPAARTTHIPPDYLKKFCLRGIGAQEGMLLMNTLIRGKVQFEQINLNAALPKVGLFDLILLRNVMIYFNAETKRRTVGRLLSQLKPGGHFVIGHSESLHEISDVVQMVRPSIYVKS